MVRRRMTLKRIDPWSVLKVGFVANLALLAIGLLGGAVMWFFVRRLELIEKVCGMALEVGFSSCSVDGGNLFRAVLLLGLLWVVVQTGLLVFWAFLANLISDLTGGLRFTFTDDTPTGTTRSASGRSTFTEDTRRTSSNEERSGQRAGAGASRSQAAATSGAGAGSSESGGRRPDGG